jgi:chromosome segregation ATPase
VLSDRQEFNSSCNTNSKEQTIILGCYTGQRIYIYNITDPRLPGVRQVTAAHEMLHAAYDRLSRDEKTELHALIDTELKKITDARILNLIDIYNKTEPGELYNEMHSIFGTEVATLSPGLETHYKKYFIDRNKVVAFSAQYESVFTALKAKQQSLIADLESLANEIKERNNDLSEAVKDLDRDIRNFNQRANEGDFESQAAFNAERNVLVARQLDLENDREIINQMIAAHEQKRKELEALNLEVNSLNQSLDSTPAEVPSI